MLWLCLYLPELPLDAFGLATDDALAVVDRKGSKRWIAACNTCCRTAGIKVGIDATTAMVLVPEVCLIERSRRQEQQALKGLAAWAEQFTSFASFDTERLALWLEIGSGLHYFGGLAPLLERVYAALVSTGYTAQVGVAPTPEAALTVARAEAGAITEETQLKSALSPLPLSALSISDEWLTAFQSFGLRNIGELFALPTDGLARRFGPAVTGYLWQLLGEASHPMRQYRRPATYRRRFELFGQIESFEGLLFPIRRILVELEGYLRGRDAAIQQINIVFKHERHAPTMLEVRCTQPTRDAARLLLLVRERIERSTLAAPVEEITVVAKRLVPHGDQQLDLLDGRVRRDGAWDALLDRLRARLGHRAVRQLGLHADHRPEKAWCVIDGNKQSEATPAFLCERPLWLIEPKPIRRLPSIIGTPERIESGWWDGEDVRRDYYIATSSEGGRWWLYRDAESRTWFLHGLWA